MPRKITTTVYKFNELSDEAKEKARSWWREHGLHYDWWDSTYEDAKTCGKLMGVTIDNIGFSGFWSQGDGAHFEGRWDASSVQPGKLKEHAPKDEELHAIAAEFERIAKAYPEAWFKVKHSGRYQHENCTDFDVGIFEDENQPWNLPEIEAEKVLIRNARRFMKWIYRQLEKEYEWRNSDEQVDETIRANGYEFTEDGRRSFVI